MPKKIPTKLANEKIKAELTQGQKRTTNFASYYVNSVHFAFTPFDIQMVCGRIEATMEAGNNETDEVAVIIMNPKHAKLVLKALEESIKGYEEINGEIIIPSLDEVKLPLKEEKLLASASPRKKK